MSPLWPTDPPVIAQQTLVWTPHAKERARTVIKNGKTITFTPKATRDAEEALAAQWVGPPVHGDISLTLILSNEFVQVTIGSMNQPTSSKLRRGDIDNYTKLILDGLNKHAWEDDRQIGRLHVVKW